VEEVIRAQGYRRRENSDAAPIIELVIQAPDSQWALEIIRGWSPWYGHAGWPSPSPRWRGG
jgi:hypothetical protein